VASMMVLVDNGAESPEQFTKLAAPMSGAELEQVSWATYCTRAVCWHACSHMLPSTG
jgi:hypothetical protein